MATKTISIMDDVYRLLLRSKTRSESFSDTIRRILTKNDSVLEFAGVWREIKKEDIKNMKKIVADLRKRSSSELEKHDLH